METGTGSALEQNCGTLSAFEIVFLFLFQGSKLQCSIQSNVQRVAVRCLYVPRCRRRIEASLVDVAMFEGPLPNTSSPDPKKQEEDGRGKEPQNQMSII